MKKFLDIKILIIIILIIILSIMLKIYFSGGNNGKIIENFPIRNESNNLEDTNNLTSSSTIIETTTQILSNLTENLELHSTYYLSESFVKQNLEIKEGENILQYTNETYLVAPYDCVITELNLPSEKDICTSEHYITISSTKILAVQIQVDETEINNISIGQTAKIEVPATQENEIEGYVTNISSTANNGRFTVTIQFENSGNIKIGMTANVEI